MTNTVSAPPGANNAPVRKSVTVRASAAHAFHIFTDDIGSWWPRTHHIGKSPMTGATFESKVGGRCYSEQEDGSECDWGSVLAWEPPRRVVFAWQITPEWQFEPDVKKSSEVEVIFTQLGDGTTRVDLEHRHFDRHGPNGGAMRAAIDSPSGWTGVLAPFIAAAERDS